MSSRILLAFLALQSTTMAGDESYMRRFVSNWRGDGNVRCHLEPADGAHNVTLSGRCPSRLIPSKIIEAKLRYYAASNSYSGACIFDEAPPDFLSGHDVQTLDVQWPLLVNDHLDAIVQIFNDARVFTLTTIDLISVDGKPVVISNLSFTPQPVP